MFAAGHVIARHELARLIQHRAKDVDVVRELLIILGRILAFPVDLKINQPNSNTDPLLLHQLHLPPMPCLQQ